MTVLAKCVMRGGISAPLIRRCRSHMYPSEWHNLSGAAQALARTVLAALDHPGMQKQAERDAQVMLDRLWALGFRPSE